MNYPIPLSPDEAIVKDSTGKQVYGSSAFSTSTRGHVWLTNQRLVYRAGVLASPQVFPLNTVEQVDIQNVRMMNVVRLVYPAGAQALFAVKGPQEWVTAIDQLRHSAPSLPSVQAPVAQAGGFPRPLLFGMIGIGLLTVTCFFIILIGAIGMYLVSR